MGKERVIQIHKQYRDNYRLENATEDFKEKIKSIKVDDYEDFYLDILKNILVTEDSASLKKDINLKELNRHFIDKIVKPDYFNLESCIFNDGRNDNSKPYDYDYKYMLEINQSEFIKSILDENSEHGVKDDGHLLGSILGSVCNGFLYEHWDPIHMYAQTWWKINTSHPFKNGNKRTSFISVKSKMLSEATRFILERIVERNLKIFIENLPESLIQENHKFIKKNIKIWKKPTIEDIKEKLKSIPSYLNNFIWEELNNNGEFLKLFNDLQWKVANTYSENISGDYILSLFIANITADDYKEDDNSLKERVIEIIKANLIEVLLVNENRIMKEIDTIFFPLINKIVDEAFDKKTKPGQFLIDFIDEWHKKHK